MNELKHHAQFVFTGILGPLLNYNRAISAPDAVRVVLDDHPDPETKKISILLLREWLKLLDESLINQAYTEIVAGLTEAEARGARLVAGNDEALPARSAMYRAFVEARLRSAQKRVRDAETRAFFAGMVEMAIGAGLLDPDTTAAWRNAALAIPAAKEPPR